MGKNPKTTLHEDKYHNTDLSLAIEVGNFTKIRDLYNINTQISDAEILKQIALKAHNDELASQFDVSHDGELRIYYEAKDQLNLMGEDISELIDNTNE